MSHLTHSLVLRSRFGDTQCIGPSELALVSFGAKVHRRFLDQ